MYPGMASEEMYRWQPRSPNDEIIGLMERGGATSRAYMDRMAEDQATTTREVGEHLGSALRNAPRAYQEGQRHRRHMDQTGLQMRGEEQRQEDVRRQMDDAQRQRAWMTAAEEAGGPTREQRGWTARLLTEENAPKLQELQLAGERQRQEYVPKQFALQERGVDLQGAQVGLTRQQLALDQHRAQAQAVGEALGGSYDARDTATRQLEAARLAGDQQGFQAAQASLAKAESEIHQLEKMLEANPLRGVALASGRRDAQQAQFTRAQLAEMNPATQQANAELAAVESKFHRVGQLANDAATLRNAPLFSDQSDAAAQQIARTLAEMGREADAQYILTGAGAGFTTDVGKTKAMRAQMVLQNVKKDLNDEYNRVRVIHSRAPGASAQQKLQMLGGAIQQLDQAAPSGDKRYADPQAILTGGGAPGGQGLSGMNASFLKGNIGGFQPTFQPGARQNADTGFFAPGAVPASVMPTQSGTLPPPPRGPAPGFSLGTINLPGGPQQAPQQQQPAPSQGQQQGAPLSPYRRYATPGR